MFRGRIHSIWPAFLGHSLWQFPLFSVFQQPGCCLPTILHCPHPTSPSLCPMNPGHLAIPLQPPSALPFPAPHLPPSSDLSGSSWHPSRTPYLWLLEFLCTAAVTASQLGPDTGLHGNLIGSSLKAWGKPSYAGRVSLPASLGSRAHSAAPRKLSWKKTSLKVASGPPHQTPTFSKTKVPRKLSWRLSVSQVVLFFSD